MPAVDGLAAKPRLWDSAILDPRMTGFPIGSGMLLGPEADGWRATVDLSTGLTAFAGARGTSRNCTLGVVFARSAVVSLSIRLTGCPLDIELAF